MLTKLLLGGAASSFDGWVIVSADDSFVYERPDYFVYPWNPITGFGTPTSYDDDYVQQLPWSKLSPDGKTLLIRGRHVADYVLLYPFNSQNGVIDNQNGYPMLSNSNGDGVAVWHPDSNAFAMLYANSPFVEAYKFEEGTGVISSYGSPPDYPTSFDPTDATWTTDGSFFVVGLYTAFSSNVSVRAWPWSPSTGFGSYIFLPALTGGYPTYGIRLAFNKDNTKLAFSGGARVYVCDWDNTTPTWSNKTTFAGTDLPGTVTDLVWHPDGEHLICTSYLSASSTTFTSTLFAFAIASDGTFSDPIFPPSDVLSNAKSPSISPDGNLVVVACSVNTNEPDASPPYLRAWKWNRGVGFGEEYPAATGIDDDQPMSCNFTYRTP